MKLTQNYPLHFNSSMTFELTETSIIVTYRGWNASSTREYLLSEINPRTSTYKAGYPSLSNYAGFFFVCVIASTFLRHFYPSISLILSLIFLLLSGVCVAALFFGKKEYVSFLNKSGTNLFAIRRTTKGEENQFLEELKKMLT